MEFVRANLLIVFILGGMVLSFSMQKKIYPFSQYDMYSGLLLKDYTYKSIEVWGTKLDGSRFRILPIEYFKPMSNINFEFTYRAHMRLGTSPQEFAKGFYELYQKKAQKRSDTPRIKTLSIYGVEKTVQDLIKTKKQNSTNSLSREKPLAQFPPTEKNQKSHE